ncbi:hypothetical protein FE374_16030 [Georgenia yuyongxinii]|uniref:Uncharacterized protein n=1 Tax=Georgenia yuyongxinii TaxID=2589797 RepID=A0A5B8C6A8_9MICO|nr:hypothetical protein [Georgenia yuyongxinii]QDC25928.1 hypothetical protein FE374_16030 [Georgenia yuyongxinii]
MRGRSWVITGAIGIAGVVGGMNLAMAQQPETLPVAPVVLDAPAADATRGAKQPAGGGAAPAATAIAPATTPAPEVTVPAEAATAAPADPAPRVVAPLSPVSAASPVSAPSAASAD